MAMVVMFVLTGMARLGQVLYSAPLMYTSAFLPLFIGFIKIDKHCSMRLWVSLKHLKVIIKTLHSLHTHTHTHTPIQTGVYTWVLFDEHLHSLGRKNN